MYLIVALVTVCVLGGARAQVVFSGQCPSVTVQSDFDVNRVIFHNILKYSRYNKVFDKTAVQAADQGLHCLPLRVYTVCHSAKYFKKQPHKKQKKKKKKKKKKNRPK